MRSSDWTCQLFISQSHLGLARAPSNPAQAKRSLIIFECPHPGAVWSALIVPGQAKARGAVEQEHEDPHDRRTDPGWTFPLHRPRLQRHPWISAGVSQIHRWQISTLAFVSSSRPCTTDWVHFFHNFEINIRIQIFGLDGLGLIIKLNLIIFCYFSLFSPDTFSQGEPRVLGLAMIPGHHVVSIEVEADSLEDVQGFGANHWGGVSVWTKVSTQLHGFGGAQNESGHLGCRIVSVTSPLRMQINSYANILDAAIASTLEDLSCTTFAANQQLPGCVWKYFVLDKCSCFMFKCISQKITACILTCS